MLQEYGTDLRLVGIEASALGGWLQAEFSGRCFEPVVSPLRGK